MMRLCENDHDDSWHGVHAKSNIEDKLNLAEEICVSEGSRLTPLRREVLRLILSAQTPIGAYDLLAQLKSKSLNRPAAPPTVYRSLNFLMEKGLIHRLASVNAYIPCCHPRQGHDAAFLICEKCHTVKETSALSLINQLQQITQADGFTPSHMMIEILGQCKQCTL